MTVLRMLAFTPDADVPAPRSETRPGRATSTPAPATRAAPIDRRVESAAERTDARIDPASLTPLGWRDLVEGLLLSGLAGELASNSILVKSEARRLRLELDPVHAALNTAGAREALRSALAVRFGAPVELEIALDSPSHATPAVERARDEAGRREMAIRAIEQDPRVRTLCEAFGTRVDPNLVQPID